MATKKPVLKNLRTVKWAYAGLTNTKAISQSNLHIKAKYDIYHMYLRNCYEKKILFH